MNWLEQWWIKNINKVLKLTQVNELNNVRGKNESFLLENHLDQASINVTSIQHNTNCHEYWKETMILGTLLYNKSYETFCKQMEAAVI